MPVCDLLTILRELQILLELGQPEVLNKVTTVLPDGDAIYPQISYDLVNMNMRFIVACRSEVLGYNSRPYATNSPEEFVKSTLVKASVFPDLQCSAMIRAKSIYVTYPSP